MQGRLKKHFCDLTSEVVSYLMASFPPNEEEETPQNFNLLAQEDEDEYVTDVEDGNQEVEVEPLQEDHFKDSSEGASQTIKPMSRTKRRRRQEINLWKKTKQVDSIRNNARVVSREELSV
jgi:hypothetical protein